MSTEKHPVASGKERIYLSDFLSKNNLIVTAKACQGQPSSTDECQELLRRIKQGENKVCAEDWHCKSLCGIYYNTLQHTEIELSFLYYYFHRNHDPHFYYYYCILTYY